MKMNEILNEAGYEMTPQQRRIANLGRILMDQSATTKDDGLSNMMAAVGNELTMFGATFGPRNMNDLVRKTGATEEVIKKLLAYAEKIESTKTNLAKDHDDGGLDDTNDTDDDFAEPDDAEMAAAADAAARAKRK
jgi:hypothetical protein